MYRLGQAISKINGKVTLSIILRISLTFVGKHRQSNALSCDVTYAEKVGDA